MTSVYYSCCLCSMFLSSQRILLGPCEPVKKQRIADGVRFYSTAVVDATVPIAFIHYHFVVQFQLLLCKTFLRLSSTVKMSFL